MIAGRIRHKFEDRRLVTSDPGGGGCWGPVAALRGEFEKKIVLGWCCAHERLPIAGYRVAWVSRHAHQDGAACGNVEAYRAPPVIKGGAQDGTRVWLANAYTTACRALRISLQRTNVKVPGGREHNRGTVGRANRTRARVAESVARRRHRPRSFPTLTDFGNPPHVLAVAAVVFHEGTAGHDDAPAADVPRDLTMRATESGRQEHVQRNLVDCGRKNSLQRSQRFHVADCSAHCPRTEGRRKKAVSGRRRARSFHDDVARVGR